MHVNSSSIDWVCMWHAVQFSAVPGDFFWGLVQPPYIGVRKVEQKFAVPTHCGTAPCAEVVKTAGGLPPEAVRAARKAVGNPADHAPRHPQSAPVARPDGLVRLDALPLAARAHIRWCLALVPTISAHRMRVVCDTMVTTMATF